MGKLRTRDAAAVVTARGRSKRSSNTGETVGPSAAGPTDGQQSLQIPNNALDRLVAGSNGNDERAMPTVEIGEEHEQEKTTRVQPDAAGENAHMAFLGAIPPIANMGRSPEQVQTDGRAGDETMAGAEERDEEDSHTTTMEHTTDANASAANSGEADERPFYGQEEPHDSPMQSYLDCEVAQNDWDPSADKPAHGTETCQSGPGNNAVHCVEYDCPVLDSPQHSASRPWMDTTATPCVHIPSSATDRDNFRVSTTARGKQPLCNANSGPHAARAGGKRRETSLCRQPPDVSSSRGVARLLIVTWRSQNSSVAPESRLTCWTGSPLDQITVGVPAAFTGQATLDTEVKRAQMSTTDVLRQYGGCFEKRTSRDCLRILASGMDMDDEQALDRMILTCG